MSEIIFKLLPPPGKNHAPPPSKQTKILDLKTKHDQILKKSSISNCLLVLWTKNHDIRTNAHETVFILQVLITKNHSLVIPPLKCEVLMNSLCIARTNMSPCICGSWGLWLKGGEISVLLQQNRAHTLALLPPTLVRAEGPLTLLFYCKHAGHPHWPSEKQKCLSPCFKTKQNQNTMV